MDQVEYLGHVHEDRLVAANSAVAVAASASAVETAPFYLTRRYGDALALLPAGEPRLCLAKTRPRHRRWRSTVNPLAKGRCSVACQAAWSYAGRDA